MEKKQICDYIAPGRRVHLVGIGGVSMRPLGLVLKGMGMEVTGSDMNSSVSTDELIGQISTICDYGFLPNEDGQMYVAFITKERSKKFFFGGTVLTERMVELDQEGYGPAIREEGLPNLMSTARSKKSNRTYTSVTFFPEG